MLAATIVKMGANMGRTWDRGVDFLNELQTFQGGSQAVERIVVIPEEGDRAP
jgi:hypothetical protein